MGKKGFTIIEIITVVIIVGILATLGLPVYQNIIESSKAKVCATNLETIKKAVDIYVMEHDAVPGSLSHLTPQQIEKAYAQVMQGRGAWKKKLAALIVLANQPKNLAYAQITGGSFGIPQLHCPLDRHPNGVSYGINSAIVTVQDYRNLQKTNSATVLVGDAPFAAFNFVTGATEMPILAEQRGHKKYGVAATSKVRYFLGISVSGQVGTIYSYPSDPHFYDSPGQVNSDHYQAIIR